MRTPHNAESLAWLVTLSCINLNFKPNWKGELSTQAMSCMHYNSLIPILPKPLCSLRVFPFLFLSLSLSHTHTLHQIFW